MTIREFEDLSKVKNSKDNWRLCNACANDENESQI